MNGLQQIIGGLVAFLFTLMPKDSPIYQWQALFMFHGIIAFCWGIFVWFWMPDSPMKAKCWSEEDKKLIVERLRDNRTGVQNRVFRPEQVKEAFLDPQGEISFFFFFFGFFFGFFPPSLCPLFPPPRYQRHHHRLTKNAETQSGPSS